VRLTNCPDQLIRLIRLIRIRRLEDLDRPLDQIADHLSGESSDPLAALRSLALLHRFRILPEDADERLLEQLAADYVALLPPPQKRPPALDVSAMDKLIGDRCSPAQLRCLHLVRQMFQDRDQ
jgi:DNA-binding transcriptional MerR regulator